MGRRVLLVDVHVRGLDRQLASLRHRVARVDDEVHEHLLDLTWVGLHAPEPRFEDGDDLDVLADQAAQHLVHFAEDVVQLKNSGLEKLLPAEREQLAGQRAGSVGRLGDLLDVLANAGVSFSETVEGELAVAADRGQQVVEVVSHAAGELADGLHLLCLAQAGSRGAGELPRPACEA